MSLETTEEAIDLDELDRQGEEAQKEAVKLSRQIEKKFLPPEVVQDLGKGLFGTAKKTKIDENGNKVEVDWCLSDLTDALLRGVEEKESSIRESMAEDLMIALEAQSRFFTITEHPGKKKSDEYARIVASIMLRLLSSDDEIVLDYSWGPPTETYYETEFLEVVRRTILNSYYSLFSGTHDGGIGSIRHYSDYDFFHQDVRTEEQKKCEGHEEFQRLEQERIRKSLEDREDAKWEEILEDEDIYIMDYFRECLERATKNWGGKFVLGQRAVRSGVRVYSDEEAEAFGQKEVTVGGAPRRIFGAFKFDGDFIVDQKKVRRRCRLSNFFPIFESY